MASDPARRNRLICRDREIPPGWVLVGHAHSLACPGEGDNALVIKRPGRLELVCEGSPVPEGYVRVRRTRSEHCPGEGDNAWLIQRSDREAG
jgi:hypothetical protein